MPKRNGIHFSEDLREDDEHLEDRLCEPDVEAVERLFPKLKEDLDLDCIDSQLNWLQGGEFAPVCLAIPKKSMRQSARQKAKPQPAPNEVKKFKCTMEGCDIFFTEKGNMKRHFNQFHNEEYRAKYRNREKTCPYCGESWQLYRLYQTNHVRQCRKKCFTQRMKGIMERMERENQEKVCTE